MSRLTQQNGGSSWGAAREGVSVYCLGSTAKGKSLIDRHPESAWLLSAWEWGLRLLCSEASTRGQQRASSLGKSSGLSNEA